MLQISRAAALLEYLVTWRNFALSFLALLHAKLTIYPNIPDGDA